MRMIAASQNWLLVAPQVWHLIAVPRRAICGQLLFVLANLSGIAEGRPATVPEIHTHDWLLLGVLVLWGGWEIFALWSRSLHRLVPQRAQVLRVANEFKQGVSSGAGERTVSTIFLSAALSRRSARTRGAQPASTVEDHETILLVEDEASVRKLVANCLRHYGYEVLEAGTGSEALHVWRQHDEIDLLLTDLAMPEGMSGRELAKLLRTSRPALKVIFSSGYSPDTVESGADAQTRGYYLPKPYTPAVLAKAVRQCLDGY